jgi:hypothetical protein
MRLPSKSSEGDMPLMAFTSGCDPAECFLRHIGIDDSEFVAPNSTTGHVHFYTGQHIIKGDWSAVAGGNTHADTYQWWTSASNLLKYDIIFNACECVPFDRGAGAYGAMDAYLKGGGRVFTTHFFYNWFAPNTGTPDLQSVANWTPGGPQSSSEAEIIDQTFPKGKALALWLQDNAVTTTLGQITLADTRDDVTARAPNGCNNQTCLSTQWIVHPGDNHPRYLSFNTPVGAPTKQQCGRGVFSDVHLSGGSNAAQFPGECGTADPNYALNEKALEFLFFDLSSCVQDDSQPPPPPPPQ